MTLKVNNKEYIIEKSDIVLETDQDPLIIPYGYALEERGTNSIWRTHSNTIYCSKKSAMNAIIQISKIPGFEYRIVPLYKMDGPILREYKINKILSDDKKVEKYKIRSWKLKVDIETSIGYLHKRGSVFIQLENGRIIKSGQTEKTRTISYSLKQKLKDPDIFEEVEISDEKWLYPHLLKELKSQFE